MSEQAPKFSLYSGEDESGFGEISSVEKAEQISAVVLDALQEQRKLNTFEDVVTNPNAWLVFSAEYDKKLKNEKKELNGFPESQTDYLVYAAYRIQKAKAIEQYLYQAKIKGVESARKSAIFEELKLICSAEAEQSVATALFRAGDTIEVRKEIVALFAAIGATKWGGDINDNLQRLRSGLDLEEKSEHQEALGLMRGVAGHAAAIDILHKVFGSETYSPSVEIDGRHGIDIGASSFSDADSSVAMVVQVKARNMMENAGGVLLTAISANEDERIGFVNEVDRSSLTADERIGHEREFAIGKLQGGMFWLKKQKMKIVDEENLVGVLMELRSSPYGRAFDERNSQEGYFDISTGVCNDALLEEMYRQGEGLLQEIAQMRERARSVHQGSFRIHRDKRGKVGVA